MSNREVPEYDYRSQFVEQESLPLPKVRREHQPRSGTVTPNAVTATPRMLRNASRSSSVAMNPSGDETIADCRQNSGEDAVRKLLPGISFDGKQRQDSRSTPNRQGSLGRRPSGYRPSPQQQLPPVQPPVQQQPAQQQQPQQQFHRRSIGDWEFTKTIGAGSMGKVKLARHRLTNELCAVKVVPRAAKIWQRQHMDDPPTTDQLEISKRRKELEKEVARDKRTIREGALGKLMYHPFICRLYEMIPMTNHYYMLFEYVSGGQMLDYIVSHGSLKERHARKFSRGIASALDYCHSNNIVHRDLKIENIMINKNGEIKLIDFGLSNMYDRSKLLKTYCGSLYFAAPELLSAHPYLGPEVDVWSFGVVLYVLVCGRVPFDDQSVSALHEKIKKGHVEYPEHLSKECVSILSKMLVVDPEKRASLRTIMSHPWMVKGFEGPPSNYLPRRAPLHLPLDPDIIKEMSVLEFGPQEQLIHELTEILSHPHYRACCSLWYQQHPEVAPQQQEPPQPMSNYLDPTSGYHPLISIYYLVDEMRQRKRAKLEAGRSQIQQQLQIAAQERRTDESPLVKKHNTPVIPYPKAAYASPHQPQQRPPTSPIANESLTLDMPVQQQTAKSPSPSRQRAKTYTLNDSPTTDSPKGFSLFRRLSARKPGRPVDEQPVLPEINTAVDDDAASVHSHSSVRRVGSVKVTNKEKQQLQLPPLPVTSRQQIQQHQRAVSAQVSSLDQETTAVPKPANKLHPSARAKSVGHARKGSLTFPKINYAEQQQVPPLPTTYPDEGFFDDVTIDDEEFKKERGQPKDLTEEQIISQFEHAAPGTMPSIEYPKTLFLKGFFSVQTTSTKPLPVIRYDVINVLTKLGVRFNEVPGGFVCVHTPSIETDNTSCPPPSATVASMEDSDSHMGKQVSHSSSSSSGRRNDSLSALETSFSPAATPVSTPNPKSHRRKFSVDSSFFGRKKSERISSSAGEKMPMTPAGARRTSISYSYESGEESMDSLHEGRGGSDMLVSSRVEQQRPHHTISSVTEDKPSRSNTLKVRTPLRFEIHIVKVPLVGLYGVQFKKLTGNTWMYKALAGQILNELNL